MRRSLLAPLLLLLPCTVTHVSIEPLRASIGASSAGPMQCLRNPVLPMSSTFTSSEEEGCALRCGTLGEAGCLWFALTRTSTGGFFCFMYASTRTGARAQTRQTLGGPRDARHGAHRAARNARACRVELTACPLSLARPLSPRRAAPTVDCPHNETELLADADYEVWERLNDDHGMEDDGGPPACACVCVSAATTGDAACDEANGAIAGCYAHAGPFNGAPHYEQRTGGGGGGGEPAAWLYRAHGWLLDSDPAPGHFNARYPSSHLPLGPAIWYAQCAGPGRVTTPTNLTLSCGRCPAAVGAGNRSAANVSVGCALVDELQYMAGYHVDQARARLRARRAHRPCLPRDAPPRSVLAAARPP
eukprot:1757464-Prymnesium_polylepis.1